MLNPKVLRFSVMKRTFLIFSLLTALIMSAGMMEAQTVLQSQIGNNKARFRVQYPNGRIFKVFIQKAGNKAQFRVLKQNDQVLFQGRAQNSKVSLQGSFRSGRDYRPLEFVVDKATELNYISADDYYLSFELDDMPEDVGECFESSCFVGGSNVCCGEDEFAQSRYCTGGYAPEPGDDIELRIGSECYECLLNCIEGN